MVAARWIGYGLALLFVGALALRQATRPAENEEIAGLAEEVKHLEEVVASAGGGGNLQADLAALHETIAELLYEIDRLSGEIPIPTEGEAEETRIRDRDPRERLQERIAMMEETRRINC